MHNSASAILMSRPHQARVESGTEESREYRVNDGETHDETKGEVDTTRIAPGRHLFIFKYTNTIGLPYTLKFRFNSTSILYHSGFTPRQYSAESAHKPKDPALEAQTKIPESPISRMFLQIIIKMESAVLSQYNNPRDNNSALLLPTIIQQMVASRHWLAANRDFRNFGGGAPGRRLGRAPAPAYGGPMASFRQQEALCNRFLVPETRFCPPFTFITRMGLTSKHSHICHSVGWHR
ncbi:hypothetical protein V8E51_014383 [Hyaloscypha variabilis]